MMFCSYFFIYNSKAKINYFFDINPTLTNYNLIILLFAATALYAEAAPVVSVTAERSNRHR